jgi:hypothetical protein
MNKDTKSVLKRLEGKRFIGKKDKHGNDIYEGDLIQTTEAGWKGTAFWNEFPFLMDETGGFALEPDK